MGLDMYAYKVPKKFVKNDFIIDEEFFKSNEYEPNRDFYYWRKHYDLHRWFEGLYRQKGGTAVEFNVVPVQVTLDDLDELEKAIKNNEIVNYFFPNDSEDFDLAFIEVAREAIEQGYAVYYDSWW